MKKTIGYAYASTIHRHNVNALMTAARTAFRNACAFDKLSTNAGFAFVVFSNENPHAKEYDKAMCEYLAYRKAHNV